MTSEGDRPLRIAHAYGNRRHQIDAAVSADVDFLEADIWYRAGDVWVRHERRLGFAPLLFDRRPKGVVNIGPWALEMFARYYLRLDVEPMRLTELLDRTRGRRRLLLDLKDKLNKRASIAYARRLARILADAQSEDSVIVCGQTNVLDSVREATTDLDVRHSIEEQWQWDGFLQRLDADQGLHGVCMDRRFLSETVYQVLKDNNLQVFCWTVDDPQEARSLVERGVDGIISNSLHLLEQLPRG